MTLRDWQTAATWLLGLAGDARIAVTSAALDASHPLIEALPEERRTRLRPNGDEADFGVVIAAAGVTEVGGTVHLETDLDDRIVTMLSRTLVRAVAIDTIVERLDTVAPLLAPESGPGYTSIITGASRTADIERSLTVGVQGPITDHVIIVG